MFRMSFSKINSILPANVNAASVGSRTEAPCQVPVLLPWDVLRCISMAGPCMFSKCFFAEEDAGNRGKLGPSLESMRHFWQGMAKDPRMQNHPVVSDATLWSRAIPYALHADGVLVKKASGGKIELFVWSWSSRLK